MRKVLLLIVLFWAIFAIFASSNRSMFLMESNYSTAALSATAIVPLSPFAHTAHKVFQFQSADSSDFVDWEGPLPGTSGLAWKDVASDSSGRRIAACVIRGKIYYSSDYGSSWTQSNAPTNYWDGITSDASGKYVAANSAPLEGFVGGVYLSSDYGATWRSSLPGYFCNHAVSMSKDGSVLFAAYYNDGVYKSTNKGVSWTKTSAGTRNWQIVSTNDNGNYVAAASQSGGGIYFSANFGLTWMQSNGAPNTNWRSLSFDSTGQYIAAGAYTVFLSSNYGASFSSLNSPPSDGYMYHAIKLSSNKLSSNSPTIIVGSRLGLYISYNSGVSWIDTNVAHPTQEEGIPGVDICSESEKLYVAVQNNFPGLYRTAGSITTKASQMCYTGLSYLNPPESSRVYSSYYDDGIAHKLSMLDSDLAWAPVASNSYMTIDLGSVVNVAGVVTQGRCTKASLRNSGNYNQFVKTYKVTYSTDGINYVNKLTPNTFQGPQSAPNRNSCALDEKVNQYFSSSISARYIRLYPLTWNNRICMRAGVLLGSVNKCSNSPPEISTIAGTGDSAILMVPGRQHRSLIFAASILTLLVTFLLALARALLRSRNSIKPLTQCLQSPAQECPALLMEASGLRL
jgi:photosystem II stability/assembly factor-like uncharacterized protein